MSHSNEPEQIEKNISLLIENQFPAFYREQGPVFVEFVKQYYKWMESNTVIADQKSVFTGKVTVTPQSANVVGQGTNFTDLDEGEQVALYYEHDTKDYDIFTIDTISNDTFLTVTSDYLPTFTSANSKYLAVKDQSNPLWYARHFLENKDIDNTIENFLVYFKEKYLKDIQYETATRLRNLLKHSLDIYRSKGTERGLDLLFRSVFGVPASIYYPGDDLFGASTGKWYVPRYIEISLKRNSEKLVGKQIIGNETGATAFVEALIRKTVQGRFIDVLYISAINGYFTIGEKVNSTDSILSPSERPTITGSLTTIDIDVEGSGSDLVVGDIVDIFSDYGEEGKARVANTVSATGRVTFNLLDGGYGYSANAEILVSDHILTIANVQYASTPSRYVTTFENIVQPLANIAYYDVSETFTVNVGDMLYTYGEPGGDGIGLVTLFETSSNTEGLVVVNILSGNMDSTTYYTESNTLSAAQNTYTDATCYGNTLGYYSNVIITINTTSGAFQTGEEIYQTDEYGLFIANGLIKTLAPTDPTHRNVRIEDAKGVFDTSYAVKGRTSNATANVEWYTIYAGTIDTKTFYDTDGNYVYFDQTSGNGTITQISEGTLANCGISNSLLYEETIYLTNDFIRDYLAPTNETFINDSTYGFPSYPTANLTTGVLSDIFGDVQYTIGKIQQLTGINKGKDYNFAPIVKAYEQIVVGYAHRDMVLRIEGKEGLFQIGEVITQTDPSSRGIYKSGNATHVFVEQLRLLDNNQFVVTSNSTTILEGEKSGTTANVTMIYPDNTTEFLGLNAEIKGNTAPIEGAATRLIVIDSGYGYQQDEQIRFVKTGEGYDSNTAGFAFANLLNQGFGEGYYKKKGGWLSSNKKLFDGVYYQEYSYEIRSSITLNKYEEMLKKLFHVAGTKYFGALVYKTHANSYMNCQTTMITQE
jgi:hypothetical protein